MVARRMNPRSPFVPLRTPGAPPSFHFDYSAMSRMTPEFVDPDLAHHPVAADALLREEPDEEEEEEEDDEEDDREGDDGDDDGYSE
jgi:hypothetical protein